MLAALACKKNHLIACEVALYFEVYARQSNNFFRHERFTYASMGMYIHERTLTYTSARKHTYIHTCMPTQIHAHTHDAGTRKKFYIA
jgi:hypothetical protein